MAARLYWPGMGTITSDELVLRGLLPIADEGLRRWEVSAAVRDRYLGVIEGRAKTGLNGAAWQVQTVAALQERDGLTRPQGAGRDAAALRGANAQQRAGAHLGCHLVTFVHDDG